MLQNKFEMPLGLVVKNSKIFNLYLAVIFLLSIVSISISELTLYLQIFLVTVLFLMFVLILKKQKTKRVTFLKLNKSDEWEIEVNHREKYEVELNGECIVTYFIIWLNFTTCNLNSKLKSFHILLLPDSADKDLLRQLRVRLRFLSQTNKDKISSQHQGGKENPKM